MIVRSMKVGLALLVGFALATAGFAQGSQTATLIGTVTSADGEPIPGVTVTVTSPSLIGERFTVSAANGDYIFKNLPPGTYTVRFSLEGMNTVERSASLPLGGTTRSDAQMQVSATEETIVVTGEAPSALETTTVGANFQASQVATLPLPNRNLQSVAELTGGLTDNGTVAGQVTIGGAFAYDNVFLVNGVDINDRYFGTANDLIVIEEAIEETQILTSGISAEYGRFSGGVINAITKSGGNQFTGSFRTDLTRPQWRDETPYEKDRGLTREGDLSKTYSATLGGPIVRDRVWFFLAGRDVTFDQAATLPISGQAFANTNEQTRYEYKVTGNINQSHTLQGSYTDSESVNSRERQVTPLEDAAISRNSTRENDAFAIFYNGVLSNSLFAEVRYSEKHFGFRNLGGTSTRIQDSPINYVIGSTFVTYNAPYFDATDPEDRDNEQWYGALSYFLGTESMGSHDIKVGFERFSDIGVGGNSQSSTGYTFFAPWKSTDGSGGATPVFDSAGKLIPVFDTYYATMYYWDATRGAKNDIQTTSIFVNDRWNINANWSVNLGVRYEDIVSKSQSGIPEIGSDSIVPRLGVSYDIQGNGKYKLDVTYSEYSGKANANQFGAASPSGNPSYAYGYYVGPPGEGTNFAPGFDPNNYVFYGFSNPLQTVDLDDNLKSPRTREFTVAGGMELPKGGYLKLIYSNRDTADFVEDFTDRSSRITAVQVGPFTGDQTEVRRIGNSNVPTREYQALQLQGHYRILDNWTLGGNWTYELKNDGNFEGEAGQSPATSSTFGDYPEVFSANRYFPTGRLDNFQEHKIRLWSNYSLGLGRAGALDIGAILRYDSPLTFSYTRTRFPISATQRAAGAGYFSLPASGTLFFGERGAGEFEETYSLDLAFQYSIPVWRSVEPWVKFTVTNVTNESNLVLFNTTINPNCATATTSGGCSGIAGPVDGQGLPTTFTRSAAFGTARSAADHQIPREYFINVGIRF